MAGSIEYTLALEEDLNIGPRYRVMTSLPGGGSANGHQIALSSFATPHGGQSGTWDPASVNSGAVVETTVAVVGAAVGDVAIATLSTLPAGCILTAHVSGVDAVRVTLANLSGAPVDVASGTLTILLFELV